MLYREELNELGFYSKTPNRRIYHHDKLLLLLEIIVVFEHQDYNKVKDRIIIWVPELGLVTKKPILHRGPDTEILLDEIDPKKQDIEKLIRLYEQEGR